MTPRRRDTDAPERQMCRYFLKEERKYAMLAMRMRLYRLTLLRLLGESPRPIPGADDGETIWDLPTAIEAIERDLVTRAMAKTHGNKRRAAQLLGIQRPTLYARLKTYGLTETVRQAIES